jgi:hypothetical protein
LRPSSEPSSVDRRIELAVLKPHGLLPEFSAALWTGLPAGNSGVNEMQQTNQYSIPPMLEVRFIKQRCFASSQDNQA